MKTWSFNVWMVSTKTGEVIGLVASGEGYPTEELAIQEAKKFSPRNDHKHQYQTLTREVDNHE